MKIAIDCHTLEIENWAGKEQFLASLIRELEKMSSGNEYFLYFRRPVGEFSSLPLNFKIININFATPLWQLLVLFDMLRRKIDVFCSPCTYLLPAINFLVKQFIIVYDLTTLLPDISKNHKKSTRIREKFFLRSAVKKSQAVICISKNTAKDLISFFNLKPEKVNVVYPGVRSVFRIIGKTEEKSAIIKKFTLPAKFILSVGTLEPRKNGINLVSAFKIFLEKAKHQDVFLIFVGKKGWLYDELFQKIKDYQLEERVVFLGYVSDEDLAVIYNLAICLVYPSFYEGFGLPVAEAMACGCPVVTSNLSSIPEITGQSAILVDPNSTEQIAAGLEKLCGDKAYRQELIKGGLAQVNQFNYRNTASGWLAIAEKVYKNK